MTLFSCSPKNRIPTFKDKDLLISLDKGSCLGKCAVYSLSIYKNKVALYEGKTNSDKIGKHYKVLTDSMFQALNMLFKNSDFLNLDATYPSYIEDFPSITVGYYGVKPPKIIQYKEDKPESLKVIQLKLEHLANSFDWNSLQKNKDNLEYTPVSSRDLENDIYVRDEIIIEPKAGIEVEKWVRRYIGYSVVIVNKIAPNFNYYLIQWDLNVISPDEMLEKLKQDTEIKSAEFNKKIMKRDH